MQWYHKYMEGMDPFGWFTEEPLSDDGFNEDEIEDDYDENFSG